MNPRVLVAAAAALLAGVAVVAVRGGSSSDPDDERPQPPATTATQFLSTYVDGEGRVVRHDEGGDTVSEGQAYALMLAQAAGDEDLFTRVWTWTRDNLQRDDGLFAWRWADGDVVDDAPAADADVDIASTLIEAAQRFDRPELLDEGRRVADAVLEHETVPLSDEDLLLVAGPWATDDRVVNPSYLARCGYDRLAGATGDERWEAVADGAVRVLDDLTEDELPPDWAIVDEDGTAQPIAGPDQRSEPGRYGPDAARIAARLARCPETNDIAARMWAHLEPLDGAGAHISYDLDGQVIDAGEHPVGLVAAAGAAIAAGVEPRAEQLLEQAATLEAAAPTYYGAAWIALGHTLLSEEPVFALVAATRPAQDPTSSTTSSSTTSSTSTTSTSTTSTSTTSTSTTTTTTTSTTTPPAPDTPTTEPTRPPGELSATSGAGVIERSGGQAEDRAERDRREVGAIAVGGLAAAAAAGLALGLRERAVRLRRPDPS